MSWFPGKNARHIDLDRSNTEKIELEHSAARLFMRWYEFISGRKIRHIWHNRPRKPDVSCRLEGQRLDLEIAHLYGSSQDAMRLLGRHVNLQTRKRLLEQHKFIDVDERLIDALNRILLNKSHKTYHSQCVWLIIRNTHKAWDANRIRSLQNRILIPHVHPFEQIWMVADYQGKTGIVRLDS